MRVEAVHLQFLFFADNFTDYRLNGERPEIIGDANASVWSNEEYFLKFFGNFLEHIRSSVYFSYGQSRISNLCYIDIVSERKLCYLGHVPTSYMP